MYLTREQKAKGRRTFLRMAGGKTDASHLNLGTPTKDVKTGDPVRVGVVGIGSQGSTLLGHCLKLQKFIEVEAICDINPAHRAYASQLIAEAHGKPAHQYEDWQEMAQKEKLEAVIIATPLWTHADITVGFLNSGSHVLCEKMMAYDTPSCHRMVEASQRNHKLLEIGYPRFYEPLYQAVYRNIIQPRVIGDIHFVRLHTHRNNSWRRSEKPPSTEYNPQRWGYPTWDALANWRLYKHYSQGLVGELGSHQTSLAEWYLGSTATAVYGSGGIVCYKDGREVNDHIYMTYSHPGGCMVELSVILSNDYGGLYEELVGSKGSLIVSDIDGGMLFLNEEECGADARTSRDEDGSLPWSPDWNLAFRNEIWSFCSAIRDGRALLCGSQRAMTSAISALAGNQAVATRDRVEIPAQEFAKSDNSRVEAAGNRQ
jgi:predicted dehydrogenase